LTPETLPPPSQSLPLRRSHLPPRHWAHLPNERASATTGRASERCHRTSRRVPDSLPPSLSLSPPNPLLSVKSFPLVVQDAAAGRASEQASAGTRLLPSLPLILVLSLPQIPFFLLNPSLPLVVQDLQIVGTEEEEEQEIFRRLRDKVNPKLS
jgi:hypothetical protein